MAGLTKTYPIDTALQMEDAGAAITSTEVNSGGEIDLGAGVNGAASMIGAVVVQVSAIVVNDNDESYHIELQGTNTTGFGTAADNVVLASLHLGAHEATGATVGDTGTDTPTGVYYMPFTNDFAGTAYRYVRLKVTVGGTTPSITYTAFLTQQRTMG